MLKLYALDKYDSIYVSEDGMYRMERGYGKTPNGNPMRGRWTLTFKDALIDFDQYRYDLIERQHIELCGAISDLP